MGAGHRGLSHCVTRDRPHISGGDGGQVPTPLVTRSEKSSTPSFTRGLIRLSGACYVQAVVCYSRKPSFGTSRAIVDPNHGALAVLGCSCPCGYENGVIAMLAD